jgi:hypothetical protein
MHAQAESLASVPEKRETAWMVPFFARNFCRYGSHSAEEGRKSAESFACSFEGCCADFLVAKDGIMSECEGLLFSQLEVSLLAEA